MAVPTLPAPAMATFTAPPPPARRRRCGAEQSCVELASSASSSTRGAGRRPPGRPGRATSSRGTPGPGDRDQGDLARACSSSARRLPAQRSGSERSTRVEAPGGVGPLADVLVGQQAAPDLVDGPRHGGHGGDAQPLVDLGPAGVVDAGHDVGDLVGLPGDARGEDVGVVAAGHRGQGVRLGAPGLLEVVAVEARADDARCPAQSSAGGGRPWRPCR